MYLSQRARTQRQPPRPHAGPDGRGRDLRLPRAVHLLVGRERPRDQPHPLRRQRVRGGGGGRGGGRGRGRRLDRPQPVLRGRGAAHDRGGASGRQASEGAGRQRAEESARPCGGPARRLHVLV